MRRIFCCVLICSVLLLSLTVSAYAAGTREYTLDELGMTVSLPSDYIVFSRDIDAKDPNLSAYGLTKDGLSSLMHEQNIYLNGWDEYVNQEIIITMTDSPLIDFNLYSDTTLTTFATGLESVYEDLGITVTKIDVYQHTQAKFLKIYIKQQFEGTTVYGLQYSTVYADKAINITMSSYSGQITSTKEAALKDVVDSVKFDTAPQTAETDFVPTDAFLYTDTKTGATFVVPANWVEAPLTKERETIDVKFTSLEEEGMTIMYGSTDLWNEMTAAERSGYSRSDLDNSILSGLDIADILGVSGSEVKTVTYGGREYYTARLTSSAEVYGASFSATITHMMCVENGYLYWFQFSGTSGSKLYGDFESLLGSVVLPIPDHAGASGAGSGLMSSLNPGNILLSLIVTVVIYSLPIIIYRYAVKKSAVEKKKAKRITIIYGVCSFLLMSILIYAVNGSGAAGGAILLWSWVNYHVLTGGKTETVMPEPAKADSDTSADSGILEEPAAAEPPKKVRYCSNCGHELLEDGAFCGNCGTPIAKE